MKPLHTTNIITRFTSYLSDSQVIIRALYSAQKKNYSNEGISIGYEFIKRIEEGKFDTHFQRQTYTYNVTIIEYT